jgi:hypothetical protein
LQQGDLETAVSLYRDDFISGFSLRDSISFEEWQLQQSEQLRRELSDALARLVQNASASHESAGKLRTGSSGSGSKCPAPAGAQNRAGLLSAR